MNWPFPMLVNLLIKADQVDEKDSITLKKIG
jgi:hypothetical protein